MYSAVVENADIAKEANVSPFCPNALKTSKEERDIITIYLRPRY